MDMDKLKARLIASLEFIDRHLVSKHRPADPVLKQMRDAIAALPDRSKIHELPPDARQMVLDAMRREESRQRIEAGRSPVERAIVEMYQDIVDACGHNARAKPHWWRWTCHLAGAVTLAAQPGQTSSPGSRSKAITTALAAEMDRIIRGG